MYLYLQRHKPSPYSPKCSSVATQMCTDLTVQMCLYKILLRKVVENLKELMGL